MSALLWRTFTELAWRPTGWVMAGVFCLIGGVAWMVLITGYVELSAQTVESPWAASGLTLQDHLLSPYFNFLALLLLFFGPALSMRSFAGEARGGTLELLLASPLTAGELVVAKVGGMALFVLMLVLLSAWPVALLFTVSEADPALVAGGLLGVFLIGCAIVSLGVVISAMTRHQAVAFVGTVAVAFGLYLLAGMGDFGVPDWIRALAPNMHVVGLQSGVLRLSDLVYFAVWFCVTAFAAAQRLEFRRRG